MKEESEIQYQTKFPKITICLNSMHSLQKVKEFYPELLANSSDLFHYSPLSAYYGQHALPKNFNITRVENFDHEEFMNKTYSEVDIIGCRFNDINCKSMWTIRKNRFGYCKGFICLRYQILNCSEALPSQFGSKNETDGAKSIQLLLNYNLDDWSNGGWTHFLEGYTIFLSTADDLSFSPSNGLLVADVSRGVPIVTVREERKIYRYIYFDFSRQSF